VQGQFALDGLAQILDQVEAVGDLRDGRGRQAGRSGVTAMTVPTHRLDRRVRHQPLLDRVGGVLIQHVHDRVAFQVHHDRAVGAPFALGPFIDADHLRAGHRRLGACLHPAQERVVADGESQALGKPLAGPPAERVPDQPSDGVRPAGAASAHRRDAGQAVGEHPHRTGPGTTTPPTHANVQRHGRADGRQVLQRPDERTMVRGRHAAARGAGRLRGSVSPHDPMSTLLLDVR
jgi:hypothetical protein